jgi:site-specific DNA-cytosine methylase
MKLLELFAGRGSVGKVAKSLGWDVTSLDLDFRTKPDIVADILRWNFTNYAPGLFDVIWASPPCTEYSVAKTVGTRDLDKADQIVKHTLDIIEYLRPKYFIIENPQTGMLKDRPFMQSLPFRDIDYCKYGMPYRKRTRLWNNIYCWDPQPLCKHDCPATVGKRHKEIAQRAPKSGDTGRRHTQSELYRVPSDLIDEILQSIRNETFSSIIV